MSSPPSTLLEDARMVVDGGPLGTGSKQETGQGEASPEDNSADPQPSSSLDGRPGQPGADSAHTSGFCAAASAGPRGLVTL